VKPLRGESPTGFWRYDGAPLSETDKKYYESRGVRFDNGPDGDLLPDGMRLKPKRIRSDSKFDLALAGRSVGIGRNKQPIMSEAEVDCQYEKWQAEYDSMAGEKPEFTEWAHERFVKRIAYKTLIRNMVCPERIQQSAKAVATYFEFFKSRPRAQVEISTPDQPVQNMTARDVLALALELNGLDPSNAARLLGGIHKQIQ